VRTNLAIKDDHAVWMRAGLPRRPAMNAAPGRGVAAAARYEGIICDVVLLSVLRGTPEAAINQAIVVVRRALLAR
jgi:hypothetical protein